MQLATLTRDKVVACQARLLTSLHFSSTVSYFYWCVSNQRKDCYVLPLVDKQRTPERLEKDLQIISKFQIMFLRWVYMFAKHFVEWTSRIAPSKPVRCSAIYTFISSTLSIIQGGSARCLHPGQSANSSQSYSPITASATGEWQMLQMAITLKPFTILVCSSCRNLTLVKFLRNCKIVFTVSK